MKNLKPGQALLLARHEEKMKEQLNSYEPPKGFRLLMPNEVVKHGDLYWNDVGWVNAECLGELADGLPYARRIKPVKKARGEVRTPKWSKADERRAVKMGWALYPMLLDDDTRGQRQAYEIGCCLEIWVGNKQIQSSPFKNYAVAVDWVVSEHAHYHSDSSIPAIDEKQWKTMNKAILLCCAGGSQ